MKTKIRIGFKSKCQLPLIMIWEETWNGSEIIFARVLWRTPFLHEGVWM